jgi:hypothetical protein
MVVELSFQLISLQRHLCVAQQVVTKKTLLVKNGQRLMELSTSMVVESALSSAGPCHPEGILYVVMLAGEVAWSLSQRLLCMCLLDGQVMALLNRLPLS